MFQNIFINLMIMILHQILKIFNLVIINKNNNQLIFNSLLNLNNKNKL